MFKPGILAKRFVQGKRLLYLHPAQMYLFISVVFFFLISFALKASVEKIDTNFKDEINDEVVIDSLKKKTKDSLQLVVETFKRKQDSIGIQKGLDVLKKNQKLLGIKDEDLKVADSIIQVETGIRSRRPVSGNVFGTNFSEAAIDSLIASGASDKVIYKEMGMRNDPTMFEERLYKQMLKLFRDKGAGSLFQTFYDSIPIALFFLLPIFAFILKLFYNKRGRYAHHLVFSFYYFSFLFTTFSILYGFNLIANIPNWIDVILVLSTFIYLVIAARRFYNQGRFLSFVKVSAITFIYFIFLIPFTVLVGIAAFILY